MLQTTVTNRAILLLCAVKLVLTYLSSIECLETLPTQQRTEPEYRIIRHRRNNTRDKQETPILNIGLSCSAFYRTYKVHQSIDHFLWVSLQRRQTFASSRGSYTSYSAEANKLLGNRSLTSLNVTRWRKHDKLQLFTVGWPSLPDGRYKIIGIKGNKYIYFVAESLKNAVLRWRKTIINTSPHQPNHSQRRNTNVQY